MPHLQSTSPQRDAASDLLASMDARARRLYAGNAARRPTVDLDPAADLLALMNTIQFPRATLPPVGFEDPSEYSLYRSRDASSTWSHIHDIQKSCTSLRDATLTIAATAIPPPASDPSVKEYMAWQLAVINSGTTTIAQLRTKNEELADTNKSQVDALAQLTETLRETLNKLESYKSTNTSQANELADVNIEPHNPGRPDEAGTIDNRTSRGSDEQAIGLDGHSRDSE